MIKYCTIPGLKTPAPSGRGSLGVEEKQKIISV